MSETVQVCVALAALVSLWVTVYLYIKGMKAKEFSKANIALVVCVILNVVRFIIGRL